MLFERGFKNGAVVQEKDTLLHVAREEAIYLLSFNCCSANKTHSRGKTGSIPAASLPAAATVRRTLNGNEEKQTKRERCFCENVLSSMLLDISSTLNSLRFGGRFPS